MTFSEITKIAFTEQQMWLVERMIGYWKAYEISENQEDFEIWREHAEQLAHMIRQKKEDMGF